MKKFFERNYLWFIAIFMIVTFVWTFSLGEVDGGDIVAIVMAGGGIVAVIYLAIINHRKNKEDEHE
ncbi:hypothetical protein [Thalassobacillus hwangdonensis]|uniref:Uncharacterized protein n=1 Tax=Thalassobacillus hwangdonensis TaxID=546108 RepID=A0ABW3L6R7_9BACI